ncbi:TPA: type IV secretion system protein [Pseudomonas aeruginosa]|uniref:type IV secretion system protein n=1 Tax=Pseudomonas aeruginosa group TaxID=136841 RepID=UPI00071BFF5E|nr:MULTISPECIES: type IV secretion system protein [Pseudomonas aeruginosa group]KSC39645.1 hypothetical protein AO882_24565 [Pseudomonas paraeruginosa]MCD2846553.1 type IV secretion system protein [Pseudomonas aeruginosa]MCM8577023.1 type IV secretion system protein [Pseudomonas aeruginosa]MCV0164068.1 type IV secretion system protein [Pseudomonas aeruginosa]MCV3889921.1 type IV secretion system protein [Pseudomonas aeruginosa]
MAYQPTAEIFGYMDQLTKELVASNLSTITTTITPFVGLCLTISLMVDGAFKLYGGDGEPLSNMLKKFTFWAFVLSVATAGGWYQQSLADVALKTPDEFASILVIGGKSAGTQQGEIANTIDRALTDGLETARTAFSNAGVMSGAGLASFFLAVSVLMTTAIICGVGFALILLAKFFLAITVCFGPIFIMCLLFDSTRELFSKWIGSVLNFGFMTVLLAAVFGLLMKFYGNAIQAAASPAASFPILVPILTCTLLTVVGLVVLFQVPGLASSWGSGVTVQLRRIGGGEVNALRSAAASSAASPGRRAPAAAGAAGGGGSGAAASAAGGAAGAAAKAAGTALQGMARGSRRAG